jgi:HAD superfamily hydrolase (TIGR01509 family)
MNRTRAMAWDVDGTLVDSEPLHLRALQSVCDAHGVDITDYGDTPFVGVAIGDVWRLLATRFENKFEQQTDNPEGEFRRAVTRYYLEHSSEVRVLHGARQALEHLSSLGVSLAAVSNSERPIVLANLRTIGVLDLFQVVVSLDDVGQPKPAAEPYLRALATMAVPARQAWAVEDSVSGARSARAAGLRVLIVGEDELAQGDQRLNDLRDFQHWWTTSGSQSCRAQHEFTQLATSGENE